LIILEASSSTSSFSASLILSLRGGCGRPQILEHALQLLLISSMPGGAMISTPMGTRARRSRSRGRPARPRAASCGSAAGSRHRAAARLVGRKTHRCAGQQRIEHALFGGVGGAVAHLGDFLFAGHFHGDLDQIADDRVNFATDIADFGEFGGLDLDERRLGQARQAPGDLGLADAGGADHENVLRRDFLPQRLGHLHAAPAVAQAIATARLAAFWPTMCLSSSSTISRGVICDMGRYSSSIVRLRLV
jgi:hypothetical protein